MEDFDAICSAIAAALFEFLGPGHESVQAVCLEMNDRLAAGDQAQVGNRANTHTGNDQPESTTFGDQSPEVEEHVTMSGAKDCPPPTSVGEQGLAIGGRHRF